MQNVVEDSVGFLVRLVRMMAQHPLQCLKVRVSQRGDARRKSWRDVGSEKMEIVKGPLNALEDMPRNAPQEVVSEAIVCTEEASGDRTIVPAGGGHGRREVTLERKARERGDQDAPRVCPARESDPRSSEHGRQVAAKDGAR